MSACRLRCLDFGQVMAEPKRSLSSLVLAASFPAPRPQRQVISAKTVRLEPIDPDRHGDDLYAASHVETDPAELWRSMGYAPSANRPSFQRWLTDTAACEDPLYFAVIDQARNGAGGVTSFMRIEPGHRMIVKGRNRDTAWLEPDNFDHLGHRRRPLTQM